ncbi:MAG: hypothetical protein A3E01_09840 [Gammaproteobacteria bacterium RIFCSPHIGHO2_12_FULL_63_22]|nr:MAG: hypothetical protein A3E01_09840 [Gammaproteobacteria bacterium RIFCSPHIGHO2_12_FULL_63_22]
MNLRARALAAIAWVASNSPALSRDVAGLTGAGLISYGVGLVYEPAGYIIAGMMLVATALLTGRGK